jgi:Protein of unknown function (DUF3617)
MSHEGNIMRLLIAASLTGMALVSLAACSKPAGNGAPGADASAAGPSLPGGPVTAVQMQRKPGLWKQTISMDGDAPGPGMQYCVDANSEAKLSAFAQHIPGANCTAPQMVRNLDGSINMNESCDMGANGKATTTGVIKGDFNSGYTATMDTQMSGSPVAQMNGEHKMVIVANWTGPCAPGQRGGDIIMGDGSTHNMLDDQAAAPAAGGNAAPAAGGQ